MIWDFSLLILGVLGGVWALTGALYFLSLTLLKVVKNFAKNSHENEFSLELQDMLMISK